MSISLPESLKAFVYEQAATRGYGTSSEYVCDLIRKDQERVRLRGLLLDGAASPLVPSVDREHFDSLRAHVYDRR